MKKVLLITTGGTIGSTLSEKNGYSPKSEIMKEEFFKCKPSLLEKAEVDIYEYSAILSFLMTPEYILDLVKFAKEKVKSEKYDGVIVSQGTAMLEESPFLADLFWDVDSPIVFTGAMLNKSQPDWDGSRNICNSLAICLSDESRNKGALVTLGGEVHTARECTKVNKTSLAPLSSVNFGPIGLVVDCEKVVYYRNNVKRFTFSNLVLDTNVEIVKVGMGSSALLVDCLVKSGSKAIVIEALPGGGGVSKSVFDAMKANIDNVIFVMCPRSQESICISHAGGGTGPVDQKNIGVLTAGDLNAVKTRLFLMAALKAYSTKEEIEKALNSFAF